MSIGRHLGVSLALLFAGVACQPPRDVHEEAARDALGIPDALELPALPVNNPPTREKRELGRALFYDVRLSGNQTQSCASCHIQRLGFADGLKNPTGSTGLVHRRNAQGLANAAYHSTLTWANDNLLTLEEQLPVPIRGDTPVELGVNDGNVEEVLERFRRDASMRARFERAFPDDAQLNVEKVVFALATFCRSLVSAKSPYDRFVAGNSSALSASARRGSALFNGERMECFHCHRGANLSVSYADSHTTPDTATYPFFNNGLYNVDGAGSYPAADTGLFELTGNRTDQGRFRPPNLRNVAVTAPYMHDGSLPTLESVVRHYASGGKPSPYKSGFIRGFDVTDDEVADVVAFLESLTDAEFLSNPAFAPPE